MCRLNKYGKTRIDPCLRRVIKWLGYKHKTVASCCGHGEYPMTIVIKEGVVYREIFSGTIFNGRRKIYKVDQKGFYYIPEVINQKD